MKSLLEITELYDTPFVREEREKGYNRGLIEGVEKGREEGELNMLRANILDLLRFRLNVNDTELKRVEGVLLMIQTRSELQPLFQAASCADSFSSFWVQLGGQN